MARDGRVEIFKGVTPKPTRDYLQAVFQKLRGQYDRLVIPCAGRFTVAQLATAAGWPATRIEASDISLFSSVIGYHVAGEKPDLAPLEIRFSERLSHLEQYRGTDKFAAAVLYAIKWAQLAAKTVYYQTAIREELESTPDQYIDAFHERLIALRSSVGGLDYRVADIFAQLERYRDHDRVVIFADPPVYKGSYGKQFDATAEHIQWTGVELPEFDPTTGADRVYEYAVAAKPLTVWYRLWELAERERPYVTFGHEIKAGHVKFTLVSRPQEVEVSAVPRKLSEVKSGDWAILPAAHPITAQSAIRCHRVDRSVAMYYRELFTHKLEGTSRAETYLVFSLDGYLFGVLGLVSNDALRRRKTSIGPPAVYHVFAFTTPTRYRRLNKLLMTLLTSSQFRADLCRGREQSLAFVANLAIATTCISNVPEVKSLRGVFKRLDRVRRADGRYQIHYRAEFRQESYAEVLAAWLAKDGKVLGAEPQSHRELAA